MSLYPNERVELETERLLLRPFQFEDVDHVLTYSQDPEFGRYLPIPQPYTLGDAVEFVARKLLADWSTRPRFAIVLGRQVVGGIGLNINEHHEIAELGYGLARPLWNRGLTTEAARAVVAWGFDRYPLYKIYARAFLSNSGSWRVMEKLGMTREGVLRSHHQLRGEHFDIASYGILRREWKQMPTEDG